MAATTEVQFDHVEVEKPATDYRTYRTARLANNMQVLLVSDERCDRAAAALSVRTGSLLDPPAIPGLAHFLEHMLFLGTEKYPKEDEYNEHLAKHGGGSNAYTAEAVTNYFFGVRPEALESALDRFAQFFVAPLFTESATERELQAVDSEHSKNLQEDSWRLSQLMRAAANPEHPLNHFMTGNSTTLRDTPSKEGMDVRKALLDFHERYYSANLMKLVIVGRETPEELLAMARAKFSPVVDRQAQVPRGVEIGGGKEAFPAECLARMVHVVPVNEVRSAAWQFMLPEQTPLWRSKPANYLSHLIGHEGNGSLLTALKKRGLATELNAGGALDEAGVHVFQVTVLLSEAGEAEVGLVGDLLFAYIRLLREAGPDEKLWRELQVLSDLGFKFRSLLDSESTASGLAHDLQDYEPEVALSANSRLWDYEPDKIQELLELLRCDRSRLVLLSKAHAELCDSAETWYGTKYSDKPLKPEWRARWEQAPAFGDLAQPAPSPFVPEDLRVKPVAAGEHPKWPARLDLGTSQAAMVAGSSVATGFFRKDEEFKLPKAACAFVVYCPFSTESVENRMLSELWCNAVQEELNEFAYEASVAGLHYALQAQASGMTLSFGGYNDKLPKLLAAVASRMANLTEVPEQSFTITKAILERNLSNAALRSPPYNQGVMHTSCMLNKPANSFKTRLEALQTAGTREALQGLNRSLLDHCHVECLLQGNLTNAEARELVDSFLEPLSIRQSLAKIPESGTAELPPGWTVLEHEGTNPDERNGALIVTIQAAEYSIRNHCLVNLASQVLSQRFFDELRTKQQLGYIVQASGFGEEHGFVGMRFLVQSERSPEHVFSKVRDWMVEAWEQLATSLEQAQVEEYREALAAQLKERPKSLNEEFSHNWVEVASRNLHFGRRQTEAKELESITLADLQTFAREKLAKAPGLAVMVRPQATAAEPSAEAPAAPIDAEPATVDRRWGPEDVATFRKEARWLVRNREIQRGGPGGGNESRL